MIRVVIKKADIDKNGRCPVVVQVNHDYRTKRKTLFKIDPEYWHDGRVKRSHPDQVQLNQIIRSTLNDFEGRIDAVNRSGKAWTVDDAFVVQQVSGTLQQTILNYADGQEGDGKWRNARKIRNVADKVREYDPGVLTGVITHGWLKSFQHWLTEYPTINSTATVAKYMKFIKTVLRHEFSEGRFTDQKAINYKIPAYRTSKERLTREEFKSWNEVDLPEDLELYRDFFSAMVYLRGIRVGDALQLTFNKVTDGRILVTEQKTGKIQNIQIIPELEDILSRYQGISKWYLFPILKQIPSDPKTNIRYQKHIESRTSTLNKNYKLIAAYAGINKKVTNHIARHTFASFADRSGLDSRTISKMLNHSSLKVTEGYLGELRRSDELDEAAGKVFS